MQDNKVLLERVEQSEAVFNLLDHVGWIEVVKPQLLRRKAAYEELLVAHLLGTPIPEGYGTKEQIAGRAYGIKEIISLFEQILVKGEKAFQDMNKSGFSLT